MGSDENYLVLLQFFESLKLLYHIKFKLHGNPAGKSEGDVFMSECPSNIC